MTLNQNQSIESKLHPVQSLCVLSTWRMFWLAFTENIYFIMQHFF
ncbi:hypothetical protein [Acinetobacter indicus]|nr:hypothetical protein [Acinetobacter indicus]